MMMNEATREYVLQHVDDDVRRLALAGSKVAEVDLTVALQQIKGRQTARQKIPSWAAIDAILYPVGLSMEQCSSEQTARYKAAVCSRLLTDMPSPHTLIDLTGGFGVDFAWMSEVFERSIYVERNAELCAVATANFQVLGRMVQTVCSDGIDFIRRHKGRATMVFLDPARRDDHGGRTYGISDCTPNVLEIKDELLSKADRVMLKLSPMLDWRKAVQDLGEPYIKEVHVVSVQNECKELLVVLSQEDARTDAFRFYCVNDERAWQVPATSAPVAMGEVKCGLFLYEPNASIMKAGCFSQVASAFGVQPLSANSHLFVADQYVDDFPGRKFLISAVSSMNRQEQKVVFRDVRQANVTVRNFPLSVAEVRKKLKLADGGSDYLFATTLADNRHVLILCKKLRF
jgi:hypothetical protein